MKKIVLVLLAVLCLTSMVFAGGSQGQASGAKPVVGWYTGPVQPTVIEDMKTISKYAEDKIGIGLEFVSAETATFEVMVQSGQPFDLMNLDAGPFIK
ncbi:MAG: hypothetical protein LBQ88_13870, partial [Treponema sp.]|nr:hypothetical protein [Treponema sp.]